MNPFNNIAGESIVELFKKLIVEDINQINYNYFNIPTFSDFYLGNSDENISMLIEPDWNAHRQILRILHKKSVIDSHRISSKNYADTKLRSLSCITTDFTIFLSETIDIDNTIVTTNQYKAKKWFKEYNYSIVQSSSHRCKYTIHYGVSSEDANFKPITKESFEEILIYFNEIKTNNISTTKKLNTVKNEKMISLLCDQYKVKKIIG